MSSCKCKYRACRGIEFNTAQYSLRLYLVDPVRSNRVVGLKAVRYLAIRDANLTPKLEQYNIDKYIAL